MLDTFLILLAGGVMLAVVVSDPNQVTLNWLRLAGILALSFAGVSTYWYVSRDTTVLPELRTYTSGVMIATVVFAILQLGFAQVAWRQTQRLLALAAAMASIAAGAFLLHVDRTRTFKIEFLACIGVSAMLGLALMDMLLGHAYLTASRMTIAPFRRLNLALAAALLFRGVCSLVVAHFINEAHPVDRLWPRFGLLIGTRWLVGLLVPAVFVYMAHDCIKRRSTQAATGILYVAGVTIFIGEMIALYLVKETGLPF